MADGGLLRNTRLWGFATTTARDAFGTRNGLRVGDHAVIQGSATFSGGLYRCTAASVSSSTWTAAVGSGELTAGQFPTAPGIITPAMLNNGDARSVVGVSGNASAARADIQSGGARRALMSNSGNTGIAFRAIESADLPAFTAASITGASGIISLATSAASVSVTDTTTPTDILAYTIPQGSYTNRKFRVRMGGTYVNNSGSVRIFTVNISLGGTTLYEDGSNSNGASALLTAWMMDFEIAVESSTRVHMTGIVRQHTTNAPTTGLGALDNATPRMLAPISSAGGGVAVSDLSTANRLLSVTITHPTATTLQSLVCTHYSVELVP